MRSMKSENGAITILVIVSILFIISFLISSYVIVANKVQAQKEIIAQTKSIYENYNIEDTYNSYFGKNIIPIRNKEDLLAIGTGIDKIIDGNYYNFVNNDNTVYLLMNDIEFNAYEEENLRDENENYYWVPIGQRTDLLAGFEGNNNKIRVNYIDEEDTEYTVEYSAKENYTEPEYTVKIIPRVMEEDGEILSNAIIWNTYEEEGEFQEVGEGETDITVKRLVPMQVKATSENYKNSGIETIYIENPDKIQDYNLVLGKYNFTIIPTPSNATVTINGENRTTISVSKGDSISWKVEAGGYTTKSGTHIIQDDYTMNVSLDNSTISFKIVPTPSNATVTINGVNTNEATVNYGDEVSWSVSATNYTTQTGTEIINGDITKNIVLVESAHAFGNWTVVTAATCEATGEEERICSQCGIKETRNISALGHNYVKTEVEPSYSGRGYYLYTCSRCEATYTENTSKKLILVNNGAVYTKSNWSTGFNSNNSNTWMGGTFFNGQLSEAVVALVIGNVGNYGSMWTGPINLTDAKTIEYEYYMWDTLYKTAILSSNYQKGINTTTCGVANSSQLNKNQTFVSGKYKTETFTRSGSTSNTSDLKKVTQTIDVSDLTGNYYFKMYLSHTNSKSGGSETGGLGYSGFNYIRIIYK